MSVAVGALKKMEGDIHIVRNVFNGHYLSISRTGVLGRRSGVVASFLRGISFELKPMGCAYDIPSLPCFSRPSVIRHHLMEAPA